MTVGDVLDGAFKLFKANARTAILTAAAIVVPFDLLLAFLQRHNTFGGESLGTIFNNSGQVSSSSPNPLVIVAAYTVPFLLLHLVTGALAPVAASSYIGGDDPGPAASLRATGMMLGPLLASFVVIHLVEWPMLAFCILPGLIFMSLWVRTAPVIAIEHLGAIAAMRRAWRLGQPRLFPTMGVVLLAWIIVTALNIALSIVPTVAGLAIGTASGGWVLVGIGTVLSRAVTAPILAMVTTLLYFDARIRHEGFDLAILAQGLERGAPPA